MECPATGILSSAVILRLLWSGKRSGDRSVKMVDTSATAGIGIRSQKMPVSVGGKYEAEVFAYDESGSSTIFFGVLGCQ